jgi:hypothetical protein
MLVNFDQKTASTWRKNDGFVTVAVLVWVELKFKINGIGDLLLPKKSGKPVAHLLHSP